MFSLSTSSRGSADVISPHHDPNSGLSKGSLSNSVAGQSLPAAQRLDAGQTARCADAAGRVPRQPCLAGGGTAAGVRTGPRGSPFLAPKRPDEHKPLRISLVTHTPRIDVSRTATPLR